MEISPGQPSIVPGIFVSFHGRIIQSSISSDGNSPLSFTASKFRVLGFSVPMPPRPSWPACNGDREHPSKQPQLSTLPKTNIAAVNGWLEDESSFLGRTIFRGYVSFRECIYPLGTNITSGNGFKKTSSNMPAGWRYVSFEEGMKSYYLLFLPQEIYNCY